MSQDNYKQILKELVESGFEAGILFAFPVNKDGRFLVNGESVQSFDEKEANTILNLFDLLSKETNFTISSKPYTLEEKKKGIIHAKGSIGNALITKTKESVLIGIFKTLEQQDADNLFDVAAGSIREFLEDNTTQ